MHPRIGPAVSFLLLAAFLLVNPSDLPAKSERLLASQSFFSPSLNREMRYSVYLPETEANSAKRWPTLYLLHGLGGRETDWEKLGHISGTLDRMIDDGLISPLIVVMPDGGNSWYVNSPEHGSIETAMTDDLVRHIDDRYPTDPHRKSRFIAGLSMGGYGAMRLAFHHPDLYVAAGSLSGAIFENVQSAKAFSPGQIAMFRKAFGDPVSIDAYNKANMFDQISTLQDKRYPLRTYITVGDDDGFGLYRGSIALYLALKDAGIPVEMRITDGDHNWKLWRDEIEPVLQFFTAPIRN